ncbi:glycosyltransferase [Microbacterium sp. NPDC096154]|uniref:glycosyltransferase n=1 Tax=Microbacterium sp. NPDC096154 TaxID=3155549 RepID=UPI00331B0F10
MIGYYIHHHGRGHLSRATAIARALGEPVTALSSLPRPDDWPGCWIELPLDLPRDAPLDALHPDAEPPDDARAHGRLHWVPLGSPGLRDRSAAISRWISAARPRAFVVDVSVEVALLARLHGIPTVVFALPGDRADPAHRLGFDVATGILAAWPPDVAGMLTGLSNDAQRKLVPVGAIGRLAPAADAAGDVATPQERRVLVLGGAGGDDFTAAEVAAARQQTPGWSWEHLGASGEWVPDVWPRLRAATVVLTHAGQGALADVSAARRPAIVVPQDRPHREQRTTARVLESGDWPALVLDGWPRSGAETGWASLLQRAAALDGRGWARWNDGAGADRAAAEIRRIAGAA